MCDQTCVRHSQASVLGALDHEVGSGAGFDGKGVPVGAGEGEGTDAVAGRRINTYSGVGAYPSRLNQWFAHLVSNIPVVASNHL